MSGTCPAVCQCFVRVHVSPLSLQKLAYPLLLQLLYSRNPFSSETACMRKKDWTLLALVITVLLLILIVYFIFEKWIEDLSYTEHATLLKQPEFKQHYFN